jgi:hypothetical protein
VHCLEQVLAAKDGAKSKGGKGKEGVREKGKKGAGKDRKQDQDAAMQVRMMCMERERGEAGVRARWRGTRRGPAGGVGGARARGRGARAGRGTRSDREGARNKIC